MLGLVLRPTAADGDRIRRIWMPDYFGFKSGSDRSTLARFYHCRKGATQKEINDKKIGRTEGHYNMLADAGKRGHTVVTWEEPGRGKVFQLQHNPDHTGPKGDAPPPDWEERNKPGPPAGVIPTPWKRT
jgi:hypothetical protein